jgi:hypothetical protein
MPVAVKWLVALMGGIDGVEVDIGPTKDNWLPFPHQEQSRCSEISKHILSFPDKLNPQHDTLFFVSFLYVHNAFQI